MMIRLQVSKPINFNTLSIHNGALEKRVTEYRFNLPYEALDLQIDYGLQSLPTLTQILTVMGVYSTLWFNSCKGTIAPMDIEPEGWTYPNGSPLPPSYFWQWHPDPISAEALVNESNLLLDDAEALLRDRTEGIFKSLVPFQLATTQGRTLQIEALPVLRLPEIVRPDCIWTFESENPQSLDSESANHPNRLREG